MSCPHGNPRGRCDICRMDALEAAFGVPEDHLEDADDEEVRADGGAGAASGEGHSLPASRLAAELGHYADVRRVDVQFPYRLRLKVTNNGLSRGPLRTIREFGWMVSGFSIRYNSVSVVQNDRYQHPGISQGGER